MVFGFHGDKILQFLRQVYQPTIDKVVDVAEAVKFERVSDDELVYLGPIRFLEAKFEKVVAPFRNCCSVDWVDL